MPEDPETPWWGLFDAELEDMTSICGSIQRLYRPRSDAERKLVMSLVSKQAVRKWLELAEREQEGGTRSR